MNSGQKAKSKIRMMFFEFKIQEDRCRGRNQKVNCKKKKEIAYLQANKRERMCRVSYSKV